jgi:hypothetical protein
MMRDDIQLCSIVIRGSGQDSGEIDYQILDATIRAVAKSRREELDSVLWSLVKRIHGIMLEENL